MSIGALREAYEARRYDEAIRLYQTDVASQDAEWHLLGSLAYYRKKEFFASLHAIERAAFLPAKESVRAKVFFQRGTLKRLVGDLLAAVEDFNYTLTLLKVAKELRPLLLGTTYFNLATTQEYCGSLHLAMDNYALALTEFRRESMSDYERMTLQNMTWVACELRDVARAEELWGDANALSNSQDARWRQRMLHAKVAFTRGENTTAMRVCESIETDEEIPYDIRCLSLCIVVEAGLAIKEYDNALLLANLAIQYAGKSDLDARCYITSSKVYQKAIEAKMRAGA